MLRQTILVVDDEPELLKSFTIILEDEFNVLTAPDGKEACEVFKANPFIALILLDLDMPVMKGAAALEIIRAMSEDVKIIILTGRSSHKYAKKCASLHVNGYVEKPYRIHELLYQIKKELGVDDFKVLKNLWPDDFEERFDSMSETNKKAVNYMESHYEARVVIKDIASHLEVSREHLSRIFLKECGINLKDYIRKVKIEKGMQALVRNRDLSLKDVAALVGMNDEKYFCRLFKEETGLTPGEYRKENII